jgi:hypothetical protein
MRKTTLRLAFLFMLAVLSACGGDEASTPPIGEESTPVRYNLRTDALSPQVGVWALVPESVKLEEREPGLVLSAAYDHRPTGSRATFTATVYRDPALARRVLEERLAAWRGASANRVEEIRPLADATYLLNETEGAIALVDGDSTLDVAVQTDQGLTRLDFLSVVQIGVNVLRVRTDAPVQQGGLGNATLPPSE